MSYMLRAKANKWQPPFELRVRLAALEVVIRHTHTHGSLPWAFYVCCLTTATLAAENKTPNKQSFQSHKVRVLISNGFERN